MKRQITNKTLQIGISLLFIWVAGCGKQSKTSTPNEIKIGIMTCLTGPAAEYGQQVLDGAKLAIADFETAHKQKVEVLVQDTKSTPKDAIAAFSTLTDVQGVKFVVGDVLSGPVAAIAPLANQKNVLVFAPGASTPALDDLDDMIFRNWVSDSYDAKVMADYCNEETIPRLAVVNVNNEYGQSLTKRFQQYLSNSESRLVLTRPFTEDQSDFGDIIAAILEAKPQAVYIIGYAKTTGLLARQLHEKAGDLDIRLLSNFTASEPQSLELGGVALNDLVFTDPNQEMPDTWAKAYEAKTGKKPGVVSAHSYDAATLLLEALLRTTNPTPTKVAEEMMKTRNYPGVSGITSITKYGDAQKPVFLKRLTVKQDGSSSSAVMKTITP